MTTDNELVRQYIEAMEKITLQPITKKQSTKQSKIDTFFKNIERVKI